MVTHIYNPDQGKLRGLSQMQGIPQADDEATGYFHEEDQPVIFALIMVAIALTLWCLA